MTCVNSIHCLVMRVNDVQSMDGDECAHCTINGCVLRLQYGCWVSSRMFRSGEADIVRSLLRTPRLTGGCPCSRSFSENILAPAVFGKQEDDVSQLTIGWPTSPGEILRMPTEEANCAYSKIPIDPLGYPSLRLTVQRSAVS